MPIEIRELVIKTSIEPEIQEDVDSFEEASPPATVNTEDLVDECIERVLEILEQKNSR